MPEGFDSQSTNEEDKEPTTINNFRNPTDVLGFTGEQEQVPETWPIPAAPATVGLEGMAGMKDPLAEIADVENDTSPAEIPVNGTEIEPAPIAPKIDWQTEGRRQMEAAKDRLRQAGYQDVDTAYAKTPIEGISQLSKTESRLREIGELKAEVGELKEEIRRLREMLANQKTGPELVGAEIMPPVFNPENPSETPKESEVIDTSFEVIDDKKPDPEMFPLEAPRGWGGEFWTEGIGHDPVMAATEAFAEEAQKLEKKGFWELIKTKGSRFGSYMWERLKGLGTLGLYEFHQGEKVRAIGRDIQKNIAVGSESLKQEGGLLSHDEAYDEAQKMKDLSSELVARGEVPPGRTTKEILDAMSEAISEEKREENQKIEDQMVAKALETIKARMTGAKTFSGEKVDLSDTKLREIESKLRAGIGSLRTSQLEADKIKFNEVVRTSLDPNWYKRYVAGGIEAGLMAAGTWYVTMPGGPLSSWIFGKGTLGAGKEMVKQVLHPVTGNGISGPGNLDPAIKTAYETLLPNETDPTKPLTSNLWNMAKQLFAEKGVPNPTDSQIMEVTKQLATDNATVVEKWGLAGKILDTKMPLGMAIKVGKAALLAGKLAGRATGVL